MTYDEFIKKHNGVAINYDGAAGKQCVDLATAYFNEVFGSGIKNFWYDAHHFWDLFDKNTWLKANFTKVKNTPSFVPKKGDIVVWGGSLNGGIGHVAIATGEGNTKYFYSYDQNWLGRNDPCTRVYHNYNHVLGVLRPKNQSAINPPTLETKGYKKGASTDGSYALKQLLILDGAKLDDNAIIGKGTVSAINSRLKGWGYRPNGIAGKKFIKKLREKIKK